MRGERPAAFLDRDGVLNVDRGYTYRLEDLELIPGAAAAVRQLNQAGILVVVVTNQSGIGRGYYTESDMERFNRHLMSLLEEEGARIDALYFCPYHPEAVLQHYRQDHRDRKPQPGMILRAFRELGIDPRRSFLIGDQQSDLGAAEAAGIPGYLFKGHALDGMVASILSEWQTKGLTGGC